jgi:hypothetical protein
MIISDLQYIESAESSEIQGGKRESYADSYSDAKAFGNYTRTYGDSYAIADAKNGVSLSGSNSSASSSN